MTSLQNSPSVLVDTAVGPVLGRRKGDVVIFAGIPYAAPPTGEHRFCPPRPPEPWTATRDATHFGPSAPQPPGMLGGLLSADDQANSEDCLTLNVLVPADSRPAGEHGRPVMVWVHGGGFTAGTGATSWYDGTALALRSGVMVVTLNYRLGALGFLHLAAQGGPATSGLSGLLDQVAALEWVRDNIGAFGGDPRRVTIFGESAGGMSVATLLGVPSARGLFARAIAQSGAASNVLSADHAAAIAEVFLDEGRYAGFDELRDAPLERILETQVAMPARLRNEGFEAGLEGAELVVMGMPFQPVVDGVALPQHPLDAVREGSAAGVALIAGTTRDEWNLFAMRAPGPVDAATAERRLARVVGADEAAVMFDAMRATRPDAEPGALLNTAMTELVFTRPCRELIAAQAAHADVWNYEFTWPSPAFGGALGSCHALEIPFVFHTLGRAGVAMLTGDDPPVALADAMCDAWGSFARSGDPSHPGMPAWQRWTPGSASFQFGAELARTP